MRIVAEGGAKRKGVAVDEPELQALEKKIIHNFDSQSDAFYTSGRLLDDGVIDPRDTRRVLGLAFDICRQAEARKLRPMQFGVAVPERESHATPALHRRPHRTAGLAEEVLRSRDQPAHRRMGKGRDLSGQGAVPQDGQARLPGREQAGRIRRPGPGLQLCRGLRRRPERHPVRRRADGHRRADRHGHAGAGALRLRRGAQGVPRAVDQRRVRGLPRRVGSRRRLRRGLDQDPCAQGRRRLRHQRRQDVDHQRHAGRLVLRAGQHQRRRLGPPQQDADLRADEDARVSKSRAS